MNSSRNSISYDDNCYTSHAYQICVYKVIMPTANAVTHNIYIFSLFFRLKMMEKQLIGIFLAFCVSQTMAINSNFIFCPHLCTCQSKEITCPIDRLPVNLPPDPFTILRITSPKKHSVVIPARAFRLLGNNRRLTIRIRDANITKVSAQAFDSIKEIRAIYFSNCHIGEIETNSFSNINFTSVYMFNTSIETIDNFAFHNVNFTFFYLFKSNITRISRAAFHKAQIKRITLSYSNVKFIESNAFGLWINSFARFQLRHSNLGSFECNEPSNRTFPVVSNLTINCSCSALWILKKTSVLYPERSEFLCQGEASGISLREKEKSLLTYCSNRTEALDQICSSRQNFKEIDTEPIRADSIRHVMTISLFLFNWLILFEIN